MALFNGFLSYDVAMQQKALLQLANDARASSHMEGACHCRDEWAAEPMCKYAKGGPGPHMTAGLFGIKWVLMALADGGMNDLAYNLVTTETFPGLGWMMNNPFANATTIWESFFFSDNVFSHNHPMFGSTEVWLLQSVAGIQPAPGAKGMDHVLIRPNPPRQLSHVAASYESPRGIFSIGWERVNHGMTISLNITVPPNCRATVYFPTRIGNKVLHQKHLVVEGTRWVPSIAMPEHGSYIFEVGSGYHDFQEESSTTTIE
jgi:alpha-L-rhamnosidase